MQEVAQNRLFEQGPSVKQQWTQVIAPTRGLFQIPVREIWAFRDLLLLLVRRDFVALYKQTILGPLWFILQPLLMTVVFTIVFGNIAKISTDGLPQMLFYLAGHYDVGVFRRYTHKNVRNLHHQREHLRESLLSSHNYAALGGVVQFN